MVTIQELAELITKQGDEVRNLKAAKADKDVIDISIKKLLDLKESYKTLNGGVAYQAPEAPKVEKKAKVQPEEVIPLPESKGPSKKELNKLARKEKRSAHKTNDSSVPVDEEELDKPVDNLTSDEQLVLPSQSSSNISSNVYFNPKFPPPDISRIVSVLLKQNLSFYVSDEKNGGSLDNVFLPYLSPPLNHQLKPQHFGISSISGDANIARYLCRTALSSIDLYSSSNPWIASEIDQWLDLYTSCLALDNSVLSKKIFPVLDSHLKQSTYLAGSSLTLADIAIYVLLKKMSYTPSDATSNITRFFVLIDSELPPPVTIASENPKVLVKENKVSNDVSGVKENKKSGLQLPISSGHNGVENSLDDEGGTCPPLEDAIEGQVCTRFPPEPSGYLHIGHVKAVLLNQYYAQRYKGKLIVRFDDTNPSNEKEEYAENIIQDLKTLGVHPDVMSHTSDYFSTCEKLAYQLIAEGKAYMDDTKQEVMQNERLKMIESARRNTTVEDNTKIFTDMLKGEQYAREYCLRAKIDMTSANGTMRDPVLYRFNDTPHHRTGTKFKAYPIYDFSCPIVDSIEGVTHALRTTEYNDRDEQYHWIQDALHLRPVKIQAFGKMNFVHTVLSKRKLNWFVQQGLVEGWFDPRFPTIQGCIRRGVNVEALKNFILSQGASRRVITMEWDKFWSENKKVLEETCARYMGVNLTDPVMFEITNVPNEVVIVSAPIHPQKPEIGTRVLRQYYKLWVDQSDAITFKEGEEVTFIRWGNFFIDSIVRDELGSKVISMKGRFNPDATNFSKTKKTTWLADVPENVMCTLVEFDHLISKAKLGDDEDFKDFVNPVTKKESLALCDPWLRLLPAGQVIQLERKGFFRIDRAYSSSDRPAILFSIPDGKVSKQPAVALSTGDEKKKKKK